MGKKHVSQNIWRRIKEFATKQKIEKKTEKQLVIWSKILKVSEFFQNWANWRGFRDINLTWG